MIATNPSIRAAKFSILYPSEFVWAKIPRLMILSRMRGTKIVLREEVGFLNSAIMK